MPSYLGVAQEPEEAGGAPKAAGCQPPGCLQGSQLVQRRLQLLHSCLLQHLLPQLLGAKILLAGPTCLQN